MHPRTELAKQLQVKVFVFNFKKDTIEKDVYAKYSCAQVPDGMHHFKFTPKD